jgi:hypothetical protein
LDECTALLAAAEILGLGEVRWSLAGSQTTNRLGMPERFQIRDVQLVAGAASRRIQNLLFALVEDVFVVLLPYTQSVKYDPNGFVGGSSDGLRFPGFAADSAEEFAQVVFGVM